MIRFSVTSWSFPQLTLDEVGGLAKVLGIAAIDIGYFYRSALDKQRLLAAQVGQEGFAAHRRVQHVGSKTQGGGLADGAALARALQAHAAAAAHDQGDGAAKDEAE